MNNYNPKIHHRKSIRLRGYDYSKAGLYFITICTEGKKCLFGQVERVQNFELLKSQNKLTISEGVENFQPLRQEMILNDAGKIANECWMQIPKHFPDVFLHEHIIMPNHIHGIVELRKTPVGDENFQHLRNEYQKIIPHSIGSIVRGFKIGVTKWFRNNTDVENIWQRNYYERIIRNEYSYKNISDYILNNPNNWKIDDFFKSR